MDWNNDGKKDLILGEYNGQVRIYLNTGTDADPSFTGYSLLQMGGSAFDCVDYSTPHILDWNNDGKKDVLCGESAGKVWLLINTGTDAAPVFATAVYLQNNGANLTVGSRSAPTVTDWDGDGKKDLLSGDSNGYVFYFHNLGTDDAPVFMGKSQLKIGSAPLDPGYTSRPDLVDWDGDGVLDIICGEYNGTVTLFRGLGPLSISDNRLGQAAGGALDFSLNAGRDAMNRNYFILGSLSGTEPGLPLPGGLVTLPLNWDSFTDMTISLANSPALVDFHGILDKSGNGAATLDTLGALPPNAVGAVIHFAYLLYYPVTYYPYDFVSNAVAIEIVP